MRALGQAGLGVGGPLPPEDNSDQNDRPGNRTAYDFITRLLVPLGFLAIAVSQLSPESWGFWIALGIALISFLIGIYHPSKAKIERWVTRWRDKRWTRNAYPEFKQLVGRFGQFVDPDNEDPLSEIVRKELQQERITSREDLGATKEKVFQEFYGHLDRRLERQNPDFASILASVSEFNSLVSQYLIQTVEPVYREIPRTVESDQLPDDAKRELELFRQRFTRFLNEYEQFFQEFSESIETEHVQDPYLSHPRPLP